MRQRILTAACIFSLIVLTACGNAGNSSSQASGASSSADSAVSVDLSAFYQTLREKYEFPNGLTLVDSEIMDMLYEGLSSVDLLQNQVYYNQMSFNMGEIAMVQVKNRQDVDTVKAIFQNRIDNMVSTNAFYPDAAEQWSNNAQVVSTGDYVLMIVNADCQSIVDDFYAYCG